MDSSIEATLDALRWRSGNKNDPWCDAAEMELHLLTFWLKRNPWYLENSTVVHCSECEEAFVRSPAAPRKRTCSRECARARKTRRQWARRKGEAYPY